jgi:hypothetical protein
MGRYEYGLEAIEAVADLCLTSRTATAIRYAELTDAAVAVIMSTGGVIDYCFLSEAMKSLPQLDWLRKGTPLPSNTATARLAAERKRVLAAERVQDTVDVREWLGGRTNAAIREESLGLGQYGKVLTILTSPTIGNEDDPDEGESDEDVIERWTPKFRR